MKIIIFTTFILFSTNCLNAQLQINSGVDTTSTKKKIAFEFMQKYIKDFKDDMKVNYLEYYSKEHCEKYKYPDKIAFSLIGETPIYIMGNPTILTIKELENDVIQFKLLFAYIKEDNVLDIPFISNHYISLKNEKPRFLIPLEFNTKDWQEVTIENIRYHFPQYHKFDTKKVNQMMSDIKQLEKDWEVATEQIDYYFANTSQEIQAIRGFDFNFYMGGNEKPSGLADTQDNIIFCNGVGENYFHEVVHIYLNKLFPKSPLKEGIAVFYGSSLGKPFMYHVKRLNDYLQKNPNTNVSNSSEFYYIDEETNPQYTIQALICKLVFQKDGIQGLKRLMTYTSMKAIYQKEFKLKKGEENKFLFEKVKEYAGLD